MQIRENIVHIIANISGRENPQAELLLLIILGYIISMILLISLHRKLIIRQKKIHEHLVLLYDTIRYELAKAQYNSPIIQESEGIKKVITTEHKTYLANATTIKQEILAIEQKNGQEIISADQRSIIHKETKKKNILTIVVQTIWWINTLFTVGIYKLFR